MKSTSPSKPSHRSPLSTASTQPTQNNNNNNNHHQNNFSFSKCQTPQEAIDVILSIEANNSLTKNHFDNSIFSKLQVLFDSTEGPEYQEVAKTSHNVNPKLGVNSSASSYLKHIIDGTNSSSNLSKEKAQQYLSLISNPRIVLGLNKIFNLTDTSQEWNAATRFFFRLIVLTDMDGESRQLFRQEWTKQFKNRLRNFYQLSFENTSAMNEMSEDKVQLSSKIMIDQTRALEFYAHHLLVETKRICNACCPKQTNFMLHTNSKEEALQLIASRQSSYQFFAKSILDASLFCNNILDSINAAVVNLQEKTVQFEQDLENLIAAHEEEQENQNQEDSAQQQQMMMVIDQKKQELQHLRTHLKIRRDAALGIIAKVRGRIDTCLAHLGGVHGSVVVAAPNSSDDDYRKVSLPLITTDLRLDLVRNNNLLFLNESNENNNNDNDNTAELASKIKTAVNFLRDTPSAVCFLSRDIIENSPAYHNNNNNNHDTQKNNRNVDAAAAPSSSASSRETDPKNPLVILFKTLVEFILRKRNLNEESTDDDNNNNNNTNTSSSLEAAFSFSAGLLAETPISPLEQGTDNNDGDKSDETKEEQQAASEYQNLLQDSGLFPRWSLAATKCLAVILTAAPSFSDTSDVGVMYDNIHNNNNQESSTSAEHNNNKSSSISPWKSFNTNQYETDFPSTVINHALFNNNNNSQDISTTTTSDDAAVAYSGDTSKTNNNINNESAQNTTATKTFSSINILFTEEDWDEIGSLLIDGVTASQLLRHQKQQQQQQQTQNNTNNANTNDNESVVIKHTFDTSSNSVATDGIASLWIAAAKFCSSTTTNSTNDNINNNPVNNERDRSNLFTSWLLALAERVIDIISESCLRHHLKTTSSSSNLINQQQQHYDDYSSLFSQLTSYVIAIFNSCAEIQPQLVSSVVQSLWEEHQQSMIDCCSLSLMQKEPHKFKTSKLVSEFIFSIVSDKFFDESVVGADEASGFLIMTESVFSHISASRRVPNTLLTVEFFLNVAAKSFSSCTAPLSQGKKILDFGYGLILQALKKSNNNNNNNNTRVDLLECVEEMLKNEEEELKKTGVGGATTVSPKERQFKKIQRVIMLYSSLIRICTSILGTMTKEQHKSDGKIEDILLDVLDFGHKKFFFFESEDNTSNFFDTFINLPVQQQQQNLADSSCWMMQAHEFFSLQMVNIAVDISNFLCHPFFLPPAGGAGGGGGNRKFATFHTVGMITVFNICNLFDVESWQMKMISTSVIRYISSIEDALDYCEDTHPRFGHIFSFLQQVDAARILRPLCLIMLAKCGIMLSAACGSEDSDGENQQQEQQTNSSLSSSSNINNNEDAAETLSSTIRSLVEQTQRLQQNTNTDNFNHTMLSGQDKEHLNEIMKTVTMLMSRTK